MAIRIVGLGGKCIDINTRAAMNQSPIVLWENYWGTSQLWNYNATEGYIESVLDPNFCIDLNISNRTLQLYQKLQGSGHDNQKWDYDSEHRLVSRYNSNLCIDVAGNNSSNGTGLIVWDKKPGPGNENQKWEFVKFPNSNAKDRLNPYETLHFNEILQSEDGRCKLIMQADGNLVLYFPNGEAPWASNTENTDANYAVMQGDGNFVIYNANNQWKWDSATDGHPGAFLILQNDGNLVIYDTNSSPLWASNTNSQLLPLSIINLSYKIFENPVTGGLPKSDMYANIHMAVQAMNLFCNNLNTNFRFRLLEEPTLIGGPNASGHTNFWFNTNIQIGSHLKELDTMALSFYNPDWPVDQTNAFAWRANAVNIFLSGIGYGGASLFPGDGNSICLAIDADRTGVSIQIHELGHFFGLPHTHDSNGMFADILTDNKDFRNADDIALAKYQRHLGALNPEESQLVENTWSNIMSYHEDKIHKRSILTRTQLSKWDLEIKTNRSNVLK